VADECYVLREWDDYPRQEIEWQGKRVPVVEGLVLVEFTTTPTKGDIYRLCLEYSMWLEGGPSRGLYTFRIKDPMELESVLRRLAREPGIKSANPNGIVSVFSARSHSHI
jgi:hypothetical protein